MGRFAFICKHAICQSEGIYDQNSKSAEMRLHPELVEELNRLKSCGVMDPEPVFKSIPPTDASGRKAIFHPLRHTFGTNLARGGVASRAAMSLMRHSDRRPMDRIYTDENLLGTSAAFDTLPNYADQASQILGAEVNSCLHMSQSTTMRNRQKPLPSLMQVTF